MELSTRLLTLEEGSSSDKVLCTAEAYPSATYSWSFLEDTVATDNLLFFDYGVTRAQAGDYECVATNRHGQTRSITTIDVLCEQGFMQSPPFPALRLSLPPFKRNFTFIGVEALLKGVPCSSFIPPWGVGTMSL